MRDYVLSRMGNSNKEVSYSMLFRTHIHNIRYLPLLGNGRQGYEAKSLTRSGLSMDSAKKTILS